MNEKICCFLGHREIKKTNELKKQLSAVIENLILNENINTFLFGSKSSFNSLCYKTVSEIKEKYLNIKRVYVRAEFAEIDEGYKMYLLERYEDTFFPENILKSGKAVYIKRNFYMIDQSNICVFYYDENYLPKNRKSGTKIALDYAIKKNKKVIVLP
ncbi:MAG: DUF1273 family protein [Clostridia bacterium]|nr:DUF1273 family protein [Clostridia bacterium]